MEKPNKRALAGRYLMALLVPAVAAGAVQLTWPLFEQSPGALFFLAIMFCAWYGGLGPGLVSVLVSLLLADYCFIAPYFTLWPSQYSDLIYLVPLTIVGPFISVLSELMHRARRRAEISIAELTRQVARSNTDITDRERAEEALRRSQEQMAGVIGSAMDAIITVDSQQRIRLFNTAAEKMFRCAAGEAIGQALDRFMPDRFRPTHSAHIQSFGETGVTTRAMAVARTIYGLRSDGEEFPLEASISQLEADGQNLYTVILRDITERKRAEMALLQLAAIVGSSDDAIMSKTLGGIITSWNAGAGRIFGYTAEEAIGQPISMLAPPDRKDEESQILERLKRGVRVEHFETVRIRKDGQQIDVSLTISPIKDDTGQIIGASKIARDITERKQAEAARRSSEGRYRTLFECAPDGIVITNPEAYYIDANASICRMLGYTRAEMLGLHSSNFLIQTEAQRINSALNEIKAEADYHQEWQFRRKDGSTFAAEVIATVMLDGNLLGMIRDITERKRAEEQLKVLAVDLERRNRELQDFASVASHDLQEPLRKIQTFADDLVENSEGLDADSRETLQRIQKAAGRMQRLINDLLALSRITSRASPSSLVDLNDLVHDVLSDLEVRLAETGGRVEVGELPHIEAEPSQMRQLIQNLISNALKFHAPGRAPVVKVHGARLNGEPPPPGSSDAPTPTRYQLIVEDNGIGFDEKYVDRIFAMFQRLHGRSEYEGTGIGLAICRKIVERHGGQITARSLPGQGATFIVTMPTKQN